MFNKNKDVPIATRAELRRFESYQPGMSIQELRRRYGLKKIVKLASNENSMGPSPRALKAYKQAAGELFRYPESGSVDLRRAIAERYKLDLGEVIIGAGSDEIIELLAMAYLSPQDNIVVSASSFLQYRIAAALMGAGVVIVPMKNMKHDLMAMAAAVTSQTKFVFVVNPNNPTGTYNTASEVSAFLKALPERVVPVFDEAYFEFASPEPDYPSMIENYFRERPMVVLRTFSKVYGLAALRVGYGVAPEECVSTLNKIRPPFNVSIPAQAAAQAALFDLKHLQKAVSVNQQQKKFLSEELVKMGFHVVPSATNFLLFGVAPRRGRAVFEALLPKGVIVRSVDEYALPDYVRVTVGTSEENKIFLAALREVVNKS